MLRVISEEKLDEMVMKSMRLIKESMGINDELEAYVDNMVSFVRNNIQKSPTIYNKDFKEFYKSLTYEGKLEDKTFKWNIIATIYPDEKYFRDIPSEGKTHSDGRRVFWGWIYFPITTDGWFDLNDLADTIYHETLHLLKRMKSKKTYKNETFIAIANNKYQTTTGLEKDIAVICYLGNGEEQDAYVNGLYGALKADLSNGKLNVRDTFKNSAVFTKLKELEKAILSIESAPEEDVNACIKVYENSEVRLTKQRLIDIGKIAVKRLYKKTNLIFNRFRMYMARYGYNSNPPRDVINI